MVDTAAIGCDRAEVMYPEGYLVIVGAEDIYEIYIWYKWKGLYEYVLRIHDD